MRLGFETIGSQYDYLYLDPLSALGLGEVRTVSSDSDLASIDLFFTTDPDSLLANKTDAVRIVLLENPAPINFHYDAVCVNSPRCKTELIHLGIPPNKIFVTGIVRLDRYMPVATVSVNRKQQILRAHYYSKEKFLETLCAENRQVITYSPSVDCDSSSFVIEALAEVLDCEKHVLVVHRHPIHYHLPIDLPKKVSSNVLVFGPDWEGLDPIDLYGYSDLVLTESVKVAVEATLLNTSVILLDYATGPSNLHVISEATGLNRVQSLLDLQANVEKGLSLAPDFTAEQMNYFLVEHLPCAFDRDSAARVAKVCDFLLKRRNDVKLLEQLAFQQFIEENESLLDPLKVIKQELEKA